MIHITHKPESSESSFSGGFYGFASWCKFFPSMLYSNVNISLRCLVVAYNLMKIYVTKACSRVVVCAWQDSKLREIN